MRFFETKLNGAFIIDLDQYSDHRGYFARAFCVKEFNDKGLNTSVAQCNLSYCIQKGTLRGMHYQIFPANETKLVRCTKGAIYDVIIDLRSDSPTYLSHVGVELTAENHRAIYVPEMFAHGYQALTNEAEIFYQVSEFYSPQYECGIRYDDPKFNITWPLTISNLSEKDSHWPFFNELNSSGGSSISGLAF